MLFLLDAVNIEFQLQQKLSTSYMLQHFTTQIHSNRFHQTYTRWSLLLLLFLRVILHWFYCDASFLLPFVNTKNCTVFFFWKWGVLYMCFICGYVKADNIA